jgi:2-furoyl-CoA dehydrogenase large subunit
MLRFEGEKEFSRHTPEEVWAKLSDARFLVQCIPDVHEVREQSAERAVCLLRPGFAFVRGTLEVTLRVAEAVSPSSILLALASKGIGTSSEVEATISLSPQESGTRVQWVAEVKSLGGLLKAVPQGLIRGAAQKVVNDAWTSVENRLHQSPPASAPEQ